MGADTGCEIASGWGGVDMGWAGDPCGTDLDGLHGTTADRLQVFSVRYSVKGKSCRRLSHSAANLTWLIFIYSLIPLFIQLLHVRR